MRIWISLRRIGELMEAQRGGVGLNTGGGIGGSETDPPTIVRL